MKGIIYKLCCDGVNEFYIGSSFSYQSRKWQHKSKCNNTNTKVYNRNIYQYIRANGGFDNWKFEILEENEFENKEALHIREQYYIGLLKPILNSRGAIFDKEQRRKNQKQYFQVKVVCECGSELSRGSKLRHQNSEKHQKYLRTINNITINNITNNITNNIANLTINN